MNQVYMQDVLRGAMEDYNELVAEGHDPRQDGDPARAALLRLQRLAETEGLTAPPRRGTTVRIIYPYHGGRAGDVGLVRRVWTDYGTTRLIARLAVGRNLAGRELVQDYPLWCLAAAPDAARMEAHHG